ncbi:hypothetical protein ACLB2K_023298 [Fragaria x ananassa]
MMNILCWLPVKSLIRFTSVSKQWRFITLSDPKFATSHFKAAHQRQTLSHRLIFSTDAPQLEMLDLDHDTPPYGRKLSFPFERTEDTEVQLLGSCNGLVFVALDDTYFYIWNPSTGFSTQFPEPGFICKALWFYGAGYSSATDDYKVFTASCDVDGDEDPEPMKMFSLRAHVWKAIQHPGHQSSVTGILLNEALHWVSGNEIFAFDLAQEEFRTMRLPHNAQTPQRHYSVHRFHYLGVCEGCLCVCLQMKGVSGSVNFWVMKEYGVYDSWTNYFYSPADHLGLSVPATAIGSTVGDSSPPDRLLIPLEVEPAGRPLCPSLVESVFHLEDGIKAVPSVEHQSTPSFIKGSPPMGRTVSENLSSLRNGCDEDICFTLQLGDNEAKRRRSDTLTSIVEPKCTCLRSPALSLGIEPTQANICKR